MCLLLSGDWRIALVGGVVSMLCVNPLVAVLVARWIGNTLRRSDQDRWRD